ncbi:unnamed protein product [Prorocentrum cordatum]|uniref:Secreted protein n=1 Tax=Prorocentrum cordatum TaxID=2364126 RepID=A0ABN9UW83_9DINO|nr:unnamed protein product [Polarella glacialis]
MPPVRATLGAAVRAVVCAWCAQAAGGLGPAAAQAPEAGHGEGAAELCAVGALLLRDCTASACAALSSSASGCCCGPCGGRGGARRTALGDGRELGARGVC